jgi:hypothetical protein
MRTETNNKTTKGRKQPRVPRKGTPRKSIESRDLNVDNETTNADRDDDSSEKKVTDVTSVGDRSVEDEEDREAKRKIADSNPADDVQN